MARNKRKKARKLAENSYEMNNASNLDQDTTSGTSGDGSGTSAPPMDPSDLTSLAIDSMEFIDDMELHEKCARVIQLMWELDLDFGRFVWSVNFGNHASRAPHEMQAARSQFRGSYLIPTLQNLRKPPRTQSKGKASANACEKIDAYAHTLVGLQFRNEMRTVEATYGGIPSNELSEDKLLGIDLKDVEEEARSCAPGLYRTLWMLGTFIVAMISGLAYQMSTANNKIQQYFGHFFRAKQAPKTVLELLSELSLSVSYSTITAAIEMLSESAERKMLQAIESRPFIMVTDNIRIGRAVGSQRLDNQAVADNGTAATALVMPCLDNVRFIHDDKLSTIGQLLGQQDPAQLIDIKKRFGRRNYDLVLAA
ncbi:hypothetical protein RSOLAG22IIIB_11805 [Rhizoctonia solani]|uniref:Uncharacterized protein n=1 Tax=Rhizoctonia solani TaxID=456999 RepID=A0A0K6GAN3_9AGAM|nr:hypothetical protein RSOLAG22IIIB_11805 [Rhizoctonia solani]